MPEFVAVTRADAIAPGTGQAFKVGAVQVAIFNIAGVFHAINNVCAHLGGPLADGPLHGNIVCCPWHGWEFDVCTGKSAFDPGTCVGSFACKVEGDEVWVKV